MVDQAGPITFYSGSPIVERARIASNGSLVLNPNQSSGAITVLDIYGGGSGALGAIRIGDNSYSAGHTNYWDIGRDNDISGAFTFALNGSEKMRITTGGNVGIGTSSPTQNLSVYAASPIVDIVATTGTSYSGLEVKNTAGSFYIGRDTTAGGFFGLANASVLWSSGTNPIAFFSNNAQRMTIDTSGNLYVGATSSYGGEKFTLDFTGSAQRGMVVRNTTSTTQDSVAFIVNSTFVGWISASTTGTTYNSISDYRLKNITGAVTGAKDFIMALQPKQGTWKSNGSKFVGFVAHEFAEVSPSSVSRTKDEIDENGNPVYQGIQASSAEVMANIISLVQEQQAQIEQQNTLIESLTARLVAVESR